MNAHTPITEPVAGVGHNGAPEEAAFDAIRVHLDDLLVEAANWADGKAVESQVQADEISRLINELNTGASTADEERMREKKPLDDQITAIQDRYNSYIAPLKNKKPGKVSTAVDALKKTLAVWLTKLDLEKAATAKKAREEAEAATQAAQEALQKAEPTNLEARQAAEDLVAAAQLAGRDANRAEADRGRAFGGSRAMSLRTYYTAEITDLSAAVRHFWTRNPEDFRDLAQKLGQNEADLGKRSGIPGITVREERRL